MTTLPDYYAILGVMPTAEDIVIRAAYKALAQRYHPDRYQGDAAEASRRMQQINDAYAILSDAVRRKAYDGTRGTGAESADSYFGADGDSVEPPNDPLSEAWNIAVGFYPELMAINNRLSKISWRLAETYRAYLLESKRFDKSKEIADGMQKEFLETYFGRNPLIVVFALDLIMHGDRATALALNKAIQVLGDVKEPMRVVQKVMGDHHGAEIKRYGMAMTEHGEWWYPGLRFESFFDALAHAEKYHGTPLWGLSREEIARREHAASKVDPSTGLPAKGGLPFALAIGFVILGLFLFVIVLIATLGHQ